MSITTGVAAAGVIALVGPLYGGLIVVLGVPLVFLTLSRTLFGSETRRMWSYMLMAAGVAWFTFLPVSPFARRSLDAHPDTWAWLVTIGAVPLVAGALFGLRARQLRTESRANSRA